MNERMCPQKEFWAVLGKWVISKRIKPGSDPREAPPAVCPGIILVEGEAWSPNVSPRGSSFKALPARRAWRRRVFGVEPGLCVCVF